MSYKAILPGIFFQFSCRNSERKTSSAILSINLDLRCDIVVEIHTQIIPLLK